MSPAQFIPLAEETGLIVPIGEWVLRTACAQNRAWQEDGLPPIAVAVNISARQFVQPDFVQMVARTLSETGLEPRCLELEITESVASENAELTAKTLSGLKAIGVQLSIDDFGTGYSSLAYLKRYPIDKLKVDQSFVRNLGADDSGGAIARAVIQLGHSLNLKVIAEGVETETHLAVLQSYACDEMQGYLFSRPVAPEALAGILAEGKKLALPAAAPQPRLVAV
ncbi:MAG: EAL domain-containing protein [Betaproteobacteria bacterium]|nr:EAL domain-containing protein [Betaproteobacteria bacterium]